MKNSIRLTLLIVGLFMVSCTNYTHEKIVKNSTREQIEVVSGCCGQEEHYFIEPGASEVVFACIYQQVKRPEATDLSWNFSVIKKDGTVLTIDNPSAWQNRSAGKKVEYLYEVK